MAQLYHVNGTATITVDGSVLGTATADGVTIKVNQYRNEIYSDEKGPNIPAEIIALGTDATVTFELWKYDDTVLTTFLSKRSGGTLGAQGTIGDLMFTGSRTSTMVIASSIDGHPFTFNRVFVADEAEFNLSIGDKVRVPMTIRCVPDASGIVFTRT